MLRAKSNDSENAWVELYRVDLMATFGKQIQASRLAVRLLPNGT